MDQVLVVEHAVTRMPVEGGHHKLCLLKMNLRNYGFDYDIGYPGPGQCLTYHHLDFKVRLLRLPVWYERALVVSKVELMLLERGSFTWISLLF